jgi:hypothetical protein
VFLRSHLSLTFTFIARRAAQQFKTVQKSRLKTLENHPALREPDGKDRRLMVEALLLANR